MVIGLSSMETRVQRNKLNQHLFKKLSKDMVDEIIKKIVLLTLLKIKSIIDDINIFLHISHFNIHLHIL